MASRFIPQFSFDQDPKTGDLTNEARKQIDDYVTKTFKNGPDDPNVSNFRSSLKPMAHQADRLDVLSQVVWFKNWSSLMSVHSVVHFHVMMYNPSSDFVSMITEDDEALSTRLSRDQENQ